MMPPRYAAPWRWLFSIALPAALAGMAMAAEAGAQAPPAASAPAAATYADLVAYILQVNGLTPGDTELPPDTAKLDGMIIAK